MSGKKEKVLVIGSGPAGLAAALFAAMRGKEVTLFEQMPKFAMKLLASGGGRCNVTNTLELQDFAMKFGRQWRFLLPALSGFFGEDLRKFFAENGVKLVLSDGFHYFPESGRAGDVLELFQRKLSSFDSRMVCNAKVGKLLISDGKICGLEVNGEQIFSDAVILCCGGRSFPALGGNGAGYKLAEQAGHHITGTFPAMGGVHVAEKWVTECAGIALPDCETYLDLPKERKNRQRGELLFTHNGLSAFAILDLCGTAAQYLEKMASVPLKVNFLPEQSENDLRMLFARWRQENGSRKVVNQLSTLLPRKLAAFLLENDEVCVANWKSGQIDELIRKIFSTTLTVTGCDSWDKAMVTRGGVALKEVNPETLESRIVKGLYFAGELLDVDGPCGGYNITWALASGKLAGSCV